MWVKILATQFVVRFGQKLLIECYSADLSRKQLIYRLLSCC